MAIRFTKKHPPVAPIPATGPRMLELRSNSVLNFVWRFHKDQAHLWRWQQLSANGEVIAESPTGHKDYEECLADAQHNGYVFQRSQTKLISKALKPISKALKPIQHREPGLRKSSGKV